MAKNLTKAGITTGNTVEAFHVTQSIDAFTGIDAYDISLSGSFNMTGSINGEPGVTNPLTASYAVTASYADNALSAINTPNAVITASNTGNDDTIEFLKGGGGAFSVTVNNVVSSSYALTASYALNSPASTDTNFANTNLTFDANRSHNTDGNDLFISVDGNFGTTTVTDAFLGIQAAELTLGFSQSAQTQYVSSGITHTGNTIISGSLTSTGLIEGAGTNTVAMYDTGSGQFFYTASSAIGGGSDTNFANTDLTFTADRNHDSNGFDFYVTADNGAFNSAYVGYGFTPTMGGVTTGSYLAVGDSYISITDAIGLKTINLVADGTSSIDISSTQIVLNSSGPATQDVRIAGALNDILFADASTTRIGINKNAPNSTLDVNGNTTITGSVSVLNGNVNITSNANFFQGSSTGGSNVSLIGVNLQDQIYIGNQGYTNIVADDTIISGSLTVTQPLSASIISASGNIEGNRLIASDRIVADQWRSSNNITIQSDANVINLNGSITASSDISSSGTVFGVTGSFSHLVGNSPITVGDPVTFQQPVTASVVSGSFEGDGGNLILTQYNFGQTQWSRTLTASVNLPNGTEANGFEFFTDANKVTDGTTTYDEYFIGYGNDMTLTGTSGTALINVSGSDYPISFDTSLQTTADNFVAASSSILLSLYDISVNSPGSNILRFGNGNQTTINNITITNQTGDLSGTLGGAVNNHVRIPYVGTAYEGQRLTHNFRVNFNIEVGSTQTLALSLKRFTDDTIIGSEIPVLRNADEPGAQFNFNSYTTGATDPFVQGGFYFALRNDSGTSTINISGSVGILIQTYYQSPTKF